MAPTQAKILVGLDPHQDSPELDWAGQEAVAQGIALQIVCAYPHVQQIWAWERNDEREITADLRDAARRRLATAHDYARATWPDLAVESKLICGYPAKVLTELSAEVNLTVLGSHHRTLLGRAFLDSVSSAVSAAASSPVVVVRRGEPAPAKDARDAEVVAGVDGFGPTDDVLTFAFEYASRHGRPLRAVYCWVNEYGPAPRIPQPHLPERARRWLHTLVEPWSDKYPDVEVRETVNDAAPTAGLVEASRGQSLLVVGGRTSHHPRIATLLGSVAQGVVHHATVPVAVVHASPAPAAQPSVATSESGA